MTPPPNPRLERHRDAVDHAERLVGLGRRIEAAEAFGRLAESYDRDGQLIEGADAAVRALELAESRERRRAVERFVDRLRGAGPEPSTGDSLARALHVLDPSADTGSDPLLLLDQAQARADAGETARALILYRRAAALLGDRERFGAAIDACTEGLAIAPTDGQLHLDLVELYLAAGWTSAASDKVRLVARLAALDEDAVVRARISAIVRRSFAGDAALMALRT